ncbi:MAG: Hsp20/alpha crystallin family protein [Gemmatimonadota bacterium]|nr:Hsp20/alpha crystallin family protein [Gemmatimonadota bacterium]HEU4989386.1 Hsp20/alpha crystallin family protein [Gemmatimonadaceae bacterium]
MIATRSLTSTLDRMLSMNRVLDDAFAGTSPAFGGRVWVPALDVSERKDAYVVAVELPGVDPKDVEVSFEHHVLTVRGTKTSTLNPSDADLRIYANERVTGSFERSIRLPEFVDGDRITARATNGLLEITVPKAAAAQPRKIAVTPVTEIANG